MGAFVDLSHCFHACCRSPISFATPASAVQVKLAAVITGHGDDNNGCGEFCVTRCGVVVALNRMARTCADDWFICLATRSHHFVVNGHPHVITFSEAGTPLGCANRVRTGVEPNEHGACVCVCVCVAVCVCRRVSPCVAVLVNVALTVSIVCHFLAVVSARGYRHMGVWP